MNTYEIICVTCSIIGWLGILTSIACWLLAYTRFMSRRRILLGRIYIASLVVTAICAFAAIVSVALAAIAHSEAITPHPHPPSHLSHSSLTTNH